MPLGRSMSYRTLRSRRSQAAEPRQAPHRKPHSSASEPQGSPGDPTEGGHLHVPLRHRLPQPYGFEGRCHIRVADDRANDLAVLDLVGVREMNVGWYVAALA